MGIYDSLSIGVASMQIAQLGLETTANNIANANTDGYSRQRLEQATNVPLVSEEAVIGRGAHVKDIARVRDEFLDLNYRSARTDLDAAKAHSLYLNQVEDLINEPSEDGLSGMMNQFFAALQELTGNPEEVAIRERVLSSAELMTDYFRFVTDKVDQLRNNANVEIEVVVERVNEFSSEIADLNARISLVESGGKTANTYRDERDRLLDELSGHMNIQTVETEWGTVIVSTGSLLLVDQSGSKQLSTVADPSIDPRHPVFVDVQDPNGVSIPITGGEIRGLIDVRDTLLPDFLDELHIVARSMIQEINRIHSDGRGLSAFTTLTTDYQVQNVGTTLDSAMTGLDFVPGAGTFDINVIDAGGTITTRTIGVDGSTDSLGTLATALNLVGGIGTSISGGRMTITSGAGFSFTLTNDTSNVLQSLGLNTFFSGSDAYDISVNSVVANDPGKFAAATDPDITAIGDGSNALNMTFVQDKKYAELEGGTTTIVGKYEAAISTFGFDTWSAQRHSDAQNVMTTALQKRREASFGVVVDEEVANIMRYQRAFEAAARIIRVADEMLDVVVNGILK
ncbi:flagellar hook-associated protein FlgK [Candidatus Hydrogenedentota bacterium]